jgi:hypothetical protein
MSIQFTQQIRELHRARGLGAESRCVIARARARRESPGDRAGMPGNIWAYRSLCGVGHMAATWLTRDGIGPGNDMNLYV